MADTIAISLEDYSEVQKKWVYWKGAFPLINEIYGRGKKPQILKIAMAIDTSTVNTLTDTTDPTNIVKDFTTPVQVYIRSDSALDVSLSVYVIGQKDDDEFGIFELTTDGTDGTTPVDCGEWKCIMYAYKKDTFAGNVIIDDDGASSTVYWTMALGDSATTGIVAIPSGYYGAILKARADLAAEPAAVATDSMIISAGGYWDAHLNQYYPHQEDLNGFKPIESETQVSMKSAFLHAVTKTSVECNIVIWEV